MLRSRVLFSVLLLGLAALPAFAQGTSSDPELSVDVLKLRLNPMTAEELDAEAKGWMGLLKAQVGEISQNEIAILGAEGDARDALVANRAGLNETQSGLEARFAAVLDELERKGGDAKSYRAYAGAVEVQEDAEGIDLSAPESLDDAGEKAKETFTFVTDWITSKDGGIKWALNIVKFLAMLFVFSFLSKMAGKLVAKALSRVDNISTLLRTFFANTVRKLVFFVGLVIAVSALGINIGPLVAAIGAVGFIVAFALQGTLSNFAAGVMILLYRPYDVGHVVSVSGTTGKVADMNMASTILNTPDNQTIVIPNGAIWNDTITNITGRDIRRVDLVFGIGYDDDIDKAEKVLAEIVKAHPKVLAEPGFAIRLHELADSSVNFIVRPWSKTADYWDVYWDLTKTVKERFDKEGLSIPYPQRDIHVHQVEKA